MPDDPTWAALLAVAPAGMDRAPWRQAAGRLADGAAVDEAMATWLRTAAAPEVEERLQAAGVPVGQALLPRLQIEHPLYAGRGFPVPVDQPGAGPLIFEGPAFTATGMAPPRCQPAPLPGQHTAEVCASVLGLDPAAIAALAEAGAIDG